MVCDSQRIAACPSARVPLFYVALSHYAKNRPYPMDSILTASEVPIVGTRRVLEDERNPG